MRRHSKLLGLITVAAALGGSGCVPDWAKQGDAPVFLLLTAVNSGNNRDAYLMQIAEQVEAILAFTQRVKAEIPPRQYESKCLATKALLSR